MLGGKDWTSKPRPSLFEIRWCCFSKSGGVAELWLINSSLQSSAQSSGGGLTSGVPMGIVLCKASGARGPWPALAAVAIASAPGAVPAARGRVLPA